MRLTSKITNACGGVYEPITNDREVCDKLGQLEDVEDELGVNLITLFKALKNGIKAKWENNEIIDLIILGGCQLWFNKKCFVLTDYKGNEWFYYFKDYGKTWALTKEELL